jgi:hypothetical protein
MGIVRQVRTTAALASVKKPFANLQEASCAVWTVRNGAENLDFAEV